MLDNPGDLLTRLCSNAQSIVVAAPYIKYEALARVLDTVSPTASIICVTRWNPHDIAMGASDPESRSLIIKSGGSFMLHPSLHAKFYRINDVVLIGSANLTSSAMGWSAQPNFEILCRAGSEFDSGAFQQQLLDGAREISDDEFRRWQAIPKITASRERTVTGEQPRVDTWRPTTRDLRHLELSYQGREDEIASPYEQKAARNDLKALRIPSGLSNEEVRIWATTCLLATPFTNAVIRLHRTANYHRSLAQNYGLSISIARRDAETTQNWLRLLAPETLR